MRNSGGPPPRKNALTGPVGAPHALPVRLVHAARVALFVVWGTLNEWWAATRLMPCNFLWLMFRAGDAQPLRDRVLAQVQRARDSGNPALDYVGIGGATMLERGEATREPAR